MLHIICALQPEAQPLLNHFGLQPVPGAARIYHNQSSAVSLTLSGIGKAGASSAVSRARTCFNADGTHAWFNLGIAGHLRLPPGQAVIVNKVTDAASGRTWFPSRVFSTALPSRDLITLEQPDSDYQEELFDMECAGFFQGTTEFACLELVQAVKIISDNANQPMGAINPTLISQLVSQNLSVVETVIQELLALSRLLRRLKEPKPDYHAIVRRWHFTVSQQHQLRVLLSKWHACHPEDTGLTARLGGHQSAAEILRLLQAELTDTPVRLAPKKSVRDLS